MKRWTCSCVAAMVALLAMATATRAAESEKLAIGQPAPDFELQSVSDGKAYKLSDFKGEKVVVITFQSLQCPWNFYRPEAGYERVLYPLAKQYESKDVQFLAINSNRTEPVEKLTSYVAQHQTPYPILKDPDNKVADAYFGQTTPHFFVIDKEGVLRYQGGFEQVPDSEENCGKMKEAYLVPAIDAVLAGQEPAHTDTMSKGCTIKREKK